MHVFSCASTTSGDHNEKQEERIFGSDSTQDNHPTVLFRGTRPPSEWHAGRKTDQVQKDSNIAKLSSDTNIQLCGQVCTQKHRHTSKPA